jgi:hypothetical protein
MPLPAGFKVNGSKTSGKDVPVPPRVLKIIAVMEKLSFGELLTSIETMQRAKQSVGSACCSHPGLADYREKVDNRLFWGNRKSIARLREQLAVPEETNEN